MKIFLWLTIVTLLLVIFMAGCGEDYTPKPRGYFRIDLPEKEYSRFDSVFPYSFEYPVYAKIVPDTRTTSEPYWMNIDFPQFNGRIHISYKPVDENLGEYLEDSRTFVIKHIPKADAIDDSLIYRPESDVYGLVYYIEGPAAASPCQFFITDSTSRFLRGALYFNFPPNNDSLAPVIDFIENDIRHLITTFRWK
ncbi:MAG: gliding motility lipoprotein GldD [Bacteroidales bacterium]|jgi:gliding motility-associated lipoprotein GldD|nr:gliding motility lipoprotein GldD [Bacteroidales bacterium]